MIEQFKRDVKQGLSRIPKRLPSKYFYDKTGDALFLKIMNLPEYYLTNAEHAIFKEKSAEMIRVMGLSPDSVFELIELGAGDGLKTKELIGTLLKENYNFEYLPVDISLSSLDHLNASLSKVFPKLKVKKKHGDYFSVLETLKETHHTKIILFLGSNIGNLTDERSADFIYQLGSNLQKGDKLILGVDLIKSKELVLPAYDDDQGITRDFNLNLLSRMNKELGADFDLSTFEHKAEYTANEGVARSFLISKTRQKVTIKSLGQSFLFEKGERLQTEMSRKYNDTILKKILKKTDFKIVGKLTDKLGYFADYILERQ